MAVYGIGTTFERKDYLDCFIDESIAFLNYSENVTPELYVLFRRIKTGDILYVKSYSPSEFIIKAVGLVLDNTIETNKISVNWIWDGRKKENDDKDNFLRLPTNMDKYNVRNIALYEEFNKNVLEKISEKAFQEREITNIEMKALWEYLGYLEVSLKCFQFVIENLDSDFDLIRNKISNYGKSVIEEFLRNNGYHEIHKFPIYSFNFFNGYLKFDANEHYKQTFEKNINSYMGSTERYIEILNNTFSLDYWSFIEPIKEKHKENFLDFLTNKEVFEDLYNQAECEVKKNDKKANNKIRSILKHKFNVLYETQENFSCELSPQLTNQHLINWQLSLQKYIEKAILLFDESSKTDVDIKLLAYIFKTLCSNGLNISVDNDAFLNFMKELLGTTPSTTEKYIRSSDMGYRQGFVTTWLKGLELLASLDEDEDENEIENKGKDKLLIRKCIKAALKDKLVKLDKPLTLEQKGFLQKLEEKYR